MPIFPLETVLFPDAALHVHIFEDRYKLLIKECLEKHTTFGVALIRSGSVVGGPADPYMIGTSAFIEEVHSYDDGRYDVRVSGARRFRIRKLDETQPYLVGHVEWVDDIDETASPDLPELVKLCADHFTEFVESVFARTEFAVQVQLPKEPSALSFAIANVMQIDAIKKQWLLEMDRASERLLALAPILANHLENIDQYSETFSDYTAPQFRKVTADDLQSWAGPN